MLLKESTMYKAKDGKLCKSIYSLIHHELSLLITKHSINNQRRLKGANHMSPERVDAYKATDDTLHNSIHACCLHEVYEALAQTIACYNSKNIPQLLVAIATELLSHNKLNSVLATARAALAKAEQDQE